MFLSYQSSLRPSVFIKSECAQRDRCHNVVRFVSFFRAGSVSGLQTGTKVTFKTNNFTVMVVMPTLIINVGVANYCCQF